MAGARPGLPRLLRTVSCDASAQRPRTCADANSYSVCDTPRPRFLTAHLRRCAARLFASDDIANPAYVSYSYSLIDATRPDRRCKSSGEQRRPRITSMQGIATYNRRDLTLRKFSGFCENAQRVRCCFLQRLSSRFRAMGSSWFLRRRDSLSGGWR